MSMRHGVEVRAAIGATQRDVRRTSNGTVMMTPAVVGVATTVLAPMRRG